MHAYIRSMYVSERACVCVCVCVCAHIRVCVCDVCDLPCPPSPSSLSLSAAVQVVGVKQVEGGDPVKFSTEVLFTADRYEIV